MTNAPHLARLVGSVALLLGCATAPAPSAAPLDAPIFVTAAGDTVRMQEELRIGRLDGPDEYTFASINWSLPTADGGVILYDLESSDGYGKSGRIRQFDAAGRFVRYIGGPGEGPGEYGPFPMGTRTVDGSLVIFDQGLRRISRYARNGEVTGMWSGPAGMVDIAPTGDGGWFVAAVTDHPSDRPRGIEYVRFDSSGTERSRMPAPDAYHDGPWSGATRAMTIVLPDGRMVSGRTDSLMFVVTAPEGNQRFVFAHEPVPYLPEERVDLEADSRAYARRRGSSVGPLPVPEFKPAYRYMFTDAEGRIMFHMRTESYRVADTTLLRPNESPWRAPFELEVFDSTPARRGRLIAPRSVTWRGASLASDAVWLVHEGEMGELYLAKWRPQAVPW